MKPFRLAVIIIIIIIVIYKRIIASIHKYTVKANKYHQLLNKKQ